MSLLENNFEEELVFSEVFLSDEEEKKEVFSEEFLSEQDLDDNEVIINNPVDDVIIDNDIDVSLTDKKQFKFDASDKILEKTRRCIWYTVPINKISKRNCDSDYNEFTIKLINSKFCSIMIGITNLHFDFKKANHFIGDDESSIGFNCCSGDKWFLHESESFSNGAQNGDEVGLKYNSIKGEIEIFINGETKGIMVDHININDDYRFAVSISFIGDKIQII